MTNETVWTWLRAKGKIFRVISNPDKGIIEVLNDKGEILIRKTNLSRRQVEMVEKKFLHFVAKKSNGETHGKSEENFDPMVT
jgi:hypothetical protein